MKINLLVKRVRGKVLKIKLEASLIIAKQLTRIEDLKEASKPSNLQLSSINLPAVLRLICLKHQQK